MSNFDNYNYNPDESIEKKLRTWIPRVTAPLSILGSSAIIFILLRDHKRKLSKSNNRILLMMSLIDVLSSIAHAFTTAPIPKETGIYGAIGNKATCIAQGFFIQIGFAVPYYNACLVLFFLLTIRWNMKLPFFARKIEPFCHFFSLFLSVGVAVLCAIMGWLGIQYDVCWIVLPCAPNDESCRIMTFTVMMSLVGVELVVCFLFITTSFFIIIEFYMKRERAVRRHSFSQNIAAETTTRTTTTRRTSSHRKETSKQAMLFIGSFFITYTSNFVHEIYYAITSNSVPALGIITSITIPLQGFWNFLIYTRPLVSRVRKRDASLSLWKALRLVIFDARSSMVPAEAHVTGDAARRGLQQRLSYSFSMMGSTDNLPWMNRRSSNRILDVCSNAMDDDIRRATKNLEQCISIGDDDDDDDDEMNGNYPLVEETLDICNLSIGDDVRDVTKFDGENHSDMTDK